MKSWVAAPSLFSAGSRVVHAPEYPELSRTVIEPPAFTGADDVVELLEAVDPGDDGLPLALLHAAAVQHQCGRPSETGGPL